MLLDTVEILYLASSQRSPGAELPVASGEGCAAFDSVTGYVYCMAGDVKGVGGGQVYRAMGRSLEKMDSPQAQPGSVTGMELAHRKVC